MIVYFIGGPADLTKQAYPDNSAPAGVLFKREHALSDPELPLPDNLGMSPTPMMVTSHLYRLERAPHERNTFMAYYGGIIDDRGRAVRG